MNDQKLEDIKRQLAAVPALPGVYLWKDKKGRVIYVGKAKQLRARMRQYVNFQDTREKIPLLVSQIDSFEYIVVENEHESLVLEKNLIQQYSPYFNADFKDNKSYPFIALTKGDVFPAIKYTREKHRADTRYFGPYTSAAAVKDTIELLNKLYQLRTCNRVLPRDTGLERPCLNYHIKQCLLGYRRPSVLRCACGLGARGVLRSRHARAICRQRQPDRALPLGQPSGVRGGTFAGNARGCGRA